jgi:hypothetical protein
MTAAINALLDSYKVISDREVLHRADTRGVVITRVQTVEMAGRRFENRTWANWETGETHHIDSVEIAVEA